MTEERNLAHRRDELTTWQQISQYLGVTDRTAQNWFKDRGLPVRKIGGRVSASTADLDRWKQQPGTTIANAIETVAQTPVQERDVTVSARKQKTARYIAVIGAVLVVLVAAGIVMFRTPSRPSAFKVAGSTLFVYGDANRELWHYTSPSPLNELSYRNAIVSDEIGPKLQFADMNGDGRIETLFTEVPE